MSRPREQKRRRHRVAKYRHAPRGTIPTTIEPPVPDGKVRCPVCRRILTPTPNGRIRQHKDPQRGDCNGAGRVVAPSTVTDHESVAAAIEESARRITTPTRKTTAHPTAHTTPEDRGPYAADPAKSRLEAGSLCQGCGRWLPGERQLCNRCQRERDGR